MSAEPGVGGSSEPQTRSSGLFGVVSGTVGYSLSNAFTSVVICELSKYCFGKDSHLHCSECSKTAKKCLQGILYCIQSLQLQQGVFVVMPKSTTCTLPDCDFK